MKKLSLLLAVLVCAAALPAAAQVSTSTCFTNASGFEFSSTWRGEGHLVQELHDYGLIFEDAKRSSCAGYAATALKNKIFSTRTTAGTNRTYQGSNATTTWIVGPYQNWLESTYVALIFASALQLGGHSQLTSALDSELNWVSYYFDNHPYSLYGKGFNCGINKPGDPNQSWNFGWSGGLSDTCMEEHAIGAAAYAWMAAYNWKRFDAIADIPYYSNTVGYAQKAKNAINKALDVADSICVKDNSPGAPFDLNTRGPCNTTTVSGAAAALNNTIYPGSLWSLNRGQNITYGFGQLTALSAAAIGLEEAQQLPTNGSGVQDPTLLFTANQKTIMKHQLWEAQNKAASDGSYFQGHLGGSPTCIRFNRTTGQPESTLYGCTDNDHRPRWFSLFGGSSSAPTFFYRFAPGTPGLSGSPYGFNGFNTQISGGYYQTGDFTLSDADANGNWGRRVWYGNLGYHWQKITANRDTYGPQPAPGETRPRLTAIFDDWNPTGYIDAVSPTGVVTGWTCDKDMNASNAVDFYAGPKGAGGTFIARATANAPSEAAVNSLCWGSNHRFSVQLPAWAQGQYIYAYGQDYTWGGEYQLPPSACIAPTCRWN